MRPASALAAAWAAVTCLVPAASAAAEGRVELELAGGREVLSTDAPDWSHASATLRHTGPDRTLMYLGFQRARRFDLEDDAWSVGAEERLGSLFSFAVDASASPDHRFLPRSDVRAWLRLLPAPGWIVNLGGRRADYTADTVNIGAAGFDYYFAVHRVAYHYHDSHLEGDERSAGSHVLQFDRYYGYASRMGIALGAGREAARIDPTTVRTVDVRTAALVGRHGFGPHWAVTWAFTWAEQGDFYDRSGGQLGIVAGF